MESAYTHTRNQLYPEDLNDGWPKLYLFHPSKRVRTLEIYLMPSSTTPIVKILNEKTLFTGHQRQKTWLYIQHEGILGWINTPSRLTKKCKYISCLRGNTCLNFKEWPGENYFFLSGRIMMGSSIASFAATNLIIFICYCIFLWILFNEHNVNGLTIFACFAFSLLYVFMIFCLWKTALMDPGIIPRGSKNHQKKDMESLSDKYCSTCRIYRPRRSKHCHSCQNCVEKFDHHCPWVGNCIGVRNYPTFVMFLISLSLNSIFVACFCIYEMIITKERESMAYPSIFALLFITSLAMLFVLFLIGYHLFLINTNQTTNEYINTRKRESPDLHLNDTSTSISFMKKWKTLICGSIPNSKLPDMRSITTLNMILERKRESMSEEVPHRLKNDSTATEVIPNHMLSSASKIFV